MIKQPEIKLKLDSHGVRVVQFAVSVQEWEYLLKVLATTVAEYKRQTTMSINRSLEKELMLQNLRDSYTILEKSRFVNVGEMVAIFKLNQTAINTVEVAVPKEFKTCNFFEQVHKYSTWFVTEHQEQAQLG